MPFTFSPSSLSLLKDCPRCFWLHFNRGIKRPAGIFPSLPSGMDRILKAHFDRYRDQGKLPPELNLNNCALFRDPILEEWRSNFKGLRYQDEDGNVLRGAVDNLLVEDGKVVVLDFKTRGFPLKNDTADHYQDQMDLYTFLLKQNGKEVSDHAYLLFYHPKEVEADGDVAFHAELVKVQVSLDNAGRILKAAVDTLRADCPEGKCAYCEWARAVK